MGFDKLSPNGFKTSSGRINRSLNLRNHTCSFAICQYKTASMRPDYYFPDNFNC